MQAIPPRSVRSGEGVVCSFNNSQGSMNQQKQQRPPALPPRGLRRPDAASYVGVSPTKFDEWVSRGVMPSPKRLDGVVIWDLRTLDAAFDALPDSNLKPGADIWDSVAT
jgi:predicted DNA-binding transcriptional regulator AlpA